MRIIAGAFKSRRLEAPTWPGLRPTSDKLRETLFNMLASRVAGARILDGFAGTGAVGLEALSRGGASVVFVDVDRRALAVIERNVARLGVAERCAIIRAVFSGALATIRRQPDFEPFDLVLLDPPYNASPETALRGVDEVLAVSGLVALEHASRQVAPDRVGSLTKIQDRRSGDSAITFYTRTDRTD